MARRRVTLRSGFVGGKTLNNLFVFGDANEVINVTDIIRLTFKWNNPGYDVSLYLRGDIKNPIQLFVTAEEFGELLGSGDNDKAGFRQGE